MGRRIIDYKIENIDTPWDHYAGSRVEEFIKSDAQLKAGLIVCVGEYGRTGSKLNGFIDYDHYLDWVKGYAEPACSTDFDYLKDKYCEYDIGLDLYKNGGQTWEPLPDFVLVEFDKDYCINYNFHSNVKKEENGNWVNTQHKGSLIILRSIDSGLTYEQVDRIEVTADERVYGLIHMDPYIVFYDEPKLNKFIIIALDEEYNMTAVKRFDIMADSVFGLKILYPHMWQVVYNKVQLDLLLYGREHKILHIHVVIGYQGTKDFEIDVGTQDYTDPNNPYVTPELDIGAEHTSQIYLTVWITSTDSQRVSAQKELPLANHV